jgi:acetyltransferase-like isoleucine patch superfamily enzyme
MSDQPWDTRRTGVTIGDDVWIGTHTTILPGVTIGSGCVIGAGAVVSSNIPEYAVAAGVPAKIIRQR